MWREEEEEANGDEDDDAAERTRLVPDFIVRIKMGRINRDDGPTCQRMNGGKVASGQGFFF
jgi:hypothetical protein